MQTLEPQLNDTKVIDGVVLHFISVDASLSGERAAFEISGLSFKSETPAFTVVQSFLQTVAGESAEQVVATTVTSTTRTSLQFSAQRLANDVDGGAHAGDTLAIRFDVLVRE